MASNLGKGMEGAWPLNIVWSEEIIMFFLSTPHPKAAHQRSDLGLQVNTPVNTPPKKKKKSNKCLNEIYWISGSSIHRKGIEKLPSNS